jgi:FAD/FMN-containing dehydrogenase
VSTTESVNSTAMRAAKALRNAFRGRVVVPGDADYEEIRMPYRVQIDPKPAIVAEAESTLDVITGIRVAREYGLRIGMENTGHGCLEALDGGLLLKTSKLNGVTIDPERRVARLGPGAIWYNVIEVAAEYGLAPVSAVMPWVAAGGYTLGGGLGWLSRKYGFGAQQLVRATVVSANGEVMTADEHENPDLLWALRGGSGNFGIVTELEVRLYPLTRVYGGIINYAIENAADMVAFYGEWAREEPEDLATGLTILEFGDRPQIPEPVRGKRVLRLRACYNGTAEQAERYLASLKASGGTPLMGEFEEMSWADLRLVTNPYPPPTRPGGGHIDLFRELPRAVVDPVIEASGELGNPIRVVEIRNWGGALNRNTEIGAVGLPGTQFSIVAEVPYTTPDQQEAIEAADDRLAERLRPYTTGGTFLNFSYRPSETKNAFLPEKYQRLTELKSKYDPDNFFRLNHNIPPVVPNSSASQPAG